jgi:hypothetical protein
VTPERCISTQRTHSPSRRTTSSTWSHCCERIYRFLTIGHAHNSRSRRLRRMRQDGRRVLFSSCTFARFRIARDACYRADASLRAHVVRAWAQEHVRGGCLSMWGPMSQTQE